MGRHSSHPLGWTVLALLVVAYAHVILELAGAAVALAVAVRILAARPPGTLAGWIVSRQERRGRQDRRDLATRRSSVEAPAGVREFDRSSTQS
jgi:hypothetical protein